MQVEVNEMKKPSVAEVEPVLLDMEAAGQYVGHSSWWVRRKIYAGELIGVSFGGKLMVEKAELDRYVALHRTHRVRPARPRPGAREVTRAQ
jgi:hypothetical protein